MDTIRTGREVRIDYTNWRGMRSVRVIQPIRIWFGSNDFHPGDNWFLRAIDLEKDEMRDFLMDDIHSFELLEK